MFTGLVEGRGIVSDIRSEGAAIRLVIVVPESMARGERTPLLGQSVAINGCCLTVVEADGRNWSFQAGTETLAKTNLGRLAKNDAVNLERALPADGRLGGHFVQGHVDGVGNVAAIARDGDWVTMRFSVPEPLAAQMVSKGSVAVDGVSLTLVDVGANSFSVALIPHTLEETTLGSRAIGDTVNIETDILGKYVQTMLGVK
jgi:riboflavin synthase